MTQIATIEELALTITEVKQLHPSTPIMILSGKGTPCAFRVEPGHYILDEAGSPRIVFKSAYDRVKTSVVYYESLSALREWANFGPMEKAYYGDDFATFEKSLVDTLAMFRAELKAINEAIPCFTVQIEDSDSTKNTKI